MIRVISIEQANKIRHIMKRMADITTVFNGEIDALNVEIDEILKPKEEKHGLPSNSGSNS